MTAMLLELADRVDALGRFDRDNYLICEILPVFGRTGERLPRAGWRQKSFGETHWCAWLRIFDDMQDVLYLLKDEVPEMIHSDPRKAVAAALRARASLTQSKGDRDDRQ